MSVIGKLPIALHISQALFGVIDNDRNAGLNLNVRGSKAVGEPLCLVLCVWLAVKHALSFVSGAELPRLALPATNEQILSRLSYYKGIRWTEHNGKNGDGRRETSEKNESASVLLT